jgi:plastocyanin
MAAAATATGLFAVTMPLTSAHATTNVGITIMSGACSGGGTAFCFDPESVAITSGSSVTWTNDSGVGHTATSCTPSACAGAPANTGSSQFNVSIGAANGSAASTTLTTPGTYYYYCMIHGYAAMHGRIIVTAQSPSPSPIPNTGRAPSSPATGAAPSPWGGIAIVFGVAMLALAATSRRR